MLASEPVLQYLHPLGTRHPDYSYESPATARIIQLPGGEDDYDNWRRNPAKTVDVDALERVAQSGMIDLVAVLTVHHLRVAGRVAGRFWETEVAKT